MELEPYSETRNKDHFRQQHFYEFLHTARSAEVDPPRTWVPSVGSRVRGCVILEYLRRGQHGSAAVCG